MHKLFIVVFGLLAAANAFSLLDVAKEEWSAFKAEHGKDYDSDMDDRFRMRVFMENKLKIARHNQLYENGLVTYKLAVNEFADLRHGEFLQIFGLNRTFNPRLKEDPKIPIDDPVSYIEPANVEMPKSVDWRKKGAVTEVKNQGHCGSCWAFATTGALEGQNFRKSGVLVSLSEQNLVDCSASYGNDGCDGGLMDQAFQYIKDNGGIDTEISYPYDAKNETCKYNNSNSAAVVKGFVDIPAGDERKLKAALATIGPIAVAIDASHESFQFYSSGIYYDPECDAEQLDHAVLAVGYGTDGRFLKRKDYYIVKNSWGTTWGLQGYVKMARNSDNHCGIASEASYPLV